MSPLIQRVKENLDQKLDDLLICLGCGFVFAALTISFFI